MKSKLLLFPVITPRQIANAYSKCAAIDSNALYCGDKNAGSLGRYSVEKNQDAEDAGELTKFQHTRTSALPSIFMWFSITTLSILAGRETLN
jgi:hypothetical protein